MRRRSTPAKVRSPAPPPHLFRALVIARRVRPLLLAAPLLVFLVAPVAALVVPHLPAALRALARDRELQAALALTAAASTGATLVAVLTGTPLAWLLARRTVPGRALIDAVLDLPLVLPHPVAGIALLLVLGRASPLGAVLVAAGLGVVGTPVGAALAMLFVAAPLYVSAARASFAAIDETHELVARTLGATPWYAFRHVTLPLAARGLAGGAAVAWARAISEFGAVIVLAYHPRVASVLAYERLTAFGLSDALPVAAALVLCAIVPLAVLRTLGAR